MHPTLQMIVLWLGGVGLITLAEHSALLPRPKTAAQALALAVCLVMHRYLMLGHLG